MARYNVLVFESLLIISCIVGRIADNTAAYTNNNNMRALQHSDTICTSEKRNGK